ncbi:hypothetical protein [Streptomyces sp. NPDC059970]|uniref:hypothetical protein n=1 Tax=Streptomyces sp. NPDC059970 TaxID=3347019 RepID=UPI0036B6663B
MTEREIADEFMTLAKELGTNGRELLVLKFLLEPSIGTIPHFGRNATATPIKTGHPRRDIDVLFGLPVLLLRSHGELD